MNVPVFDEQDFRTVTYVCNDGESRRFRPLGLKAMLLVRRALPKIATDLPWLNFANFESPHAALLRTLAQMAETVEQMQPAADDKPAADGAKAVTELVAAVKNAAASAQDKSSEEALAALIDVLEVLFSPQYCDKPLTRAQLEQADPSPASVADIPALMDIAVGQSSLEKKARLAGKASEKKD